MVREANPKGVHSAIYAKQQRERERRRRVKDLQRELKAKDAEKKRNVRGAKPPPLLLLLLLHARSLLLLHARSLLTCKLNMYISLHVYVHVRISCMYIMASWHMRFINYQAPHNL